MSKTRRLAHLVNLEVEARPAQSKKISSIQVLKLAEVHEVAADKDQVHDKSSSLTRFATCSRHDSILSNNTTLDMVDTSAGWKEKLDGGEDFIG